MEFVGCACIAYGPTLALIVFTIMQDPVRCILLVASAFFWLVAFLLSSILWYVLPLENLLILGVVFTVILQELFRYILYTVLKVAEEGLKHVSDVDSTGATKNPRKVLSYVSGLGFGIMSGTFSFINVLAAVSGPSTIGLHGGYKYFTLVSAFLTLCFTLLNTVWSVIFFSAVEKKNFILLSWVIFSHLLASCITVLNQKKLYLVVLGFTYAILVISAHLAYKTYGFTFRRCRCLNNSRNNHEISTNSSHHVIS